MRETRFRFWDEIEERYDYFTLNTITMYRDILDKHLLEGRTPEYFSTFSDRNNNHIFEGHILNIGEEGHEKPCEVIFSDGCFSIKTPWCDELIELKHYCNDLFIECVEIIGNIHETNKE